MVRESKCFFQLNFSIEVKKKLKLTPEQYRQQVGRIHYRALIGRLSNSGLRLAVAPPGPLFVW